MKRANASIQATSLLSPKTRVLTDKQVTQRMHDGCPSCGSAPLKEYPRMVRDKDGRKKYGGSFFGCPAFGKSCMFKYSLSIVTNRESIPEECAGAEDDKAAE